MDAQAHSLLSLSLPRLTRRQRGAAAQSPPQAERCEERARAHRGSAAQRMML
jgi:hypothetical protein